MSGALFRNEPISQSLVPISCVIFTKNEEINLPKCLKSLSWCDDIVVVDSFSSDRTLEIATSAGARVFQHPFTGFGDSRNWALEQVSFRHPWVLILDADEEVLPSLYQEMAERVLRVPHEVAAFRVKRKFFFFGKWLKYSSLYPTWVVRLIRKDRVRYRNRGHAETEVIQGKVEALTHDLKDENLKGLEAWLDRQNRYSSQEALHEFQEPGVRLWALWGRDPLKRREAIKSLSRKLPCRSWFFFLYNYVFRLGFLDGREGLAMSRMRAMYFQMIELKKWELKKSQSGKPL